MITREHARLLRRYIEQLAVNLPDTDAIEAVELFPKWSESEEYTTGDRVRYGELLYKCLLDHTAQASWTPDTATSLWVRVDNPAEEFPEWIQPVGSADAYALGAKVSHNDKHWISTYDNNTWEPGVFGWDEVE